MDYETVIGLEVHVQLKTRSKLFCGCTTAFGGAPNTQVCPVCLGYPGVLPVMNGEAVRQTILAGLLLGCEIARFSKWDRKNYFYPDMPKNYQISQYDLPLCLKGSVTLRGENAAAKRIGLTRIHLEEDVAKNTHFERTSGVDFNRAGTPLMEIVSEPDLRSPDEAHAYLTALREILVSGGISDCDLEKGQLRCDANVSVRLVGQQKFGAKIEIKNLNTISGVRRALAFEAQRQTAALKRGETLVQETRRWDDDGGATSVMRTKEDAHDYRYFPEPDLMPVEVTEPWLADIRAQVVELPEARRRRFGTEYRLPEYDAGVLVADRALADFFESTARAGANPKRVANWVMTELLAKLAATRRGITECPVQPRQLAALLGLVEAGRINGQMAKDVFAEMFATGADPVAIVQQQGLAQVSDAGALAAVVDQVLAAQPKSVADYRAGNQAAINFLKGQVMRLTKGQANPQVVGEILARRLAGPILP